MENDDLTLWDLAIHHFIKLSENQQKRDIAKSHIAELQLMRTSAMKIEEYRICALIKAEIDSRDKQIEEQIHAVLDNEDYDL